MRGERGGNRFDYTVGEVLLLGIGRHVVERQDRDRGLVGQRQRGGGGRQRCRLLRPLPGLPAQSACLPLHGEGLDRRIDVLQRQASEIIEVRPDAADYALMNSARNQDAAPEGALVSSRAAILTLSPNRSPSSTIRSPRMKPNAELDDGAVGRVTPLVKDQLLEFDGCCQSLHGTRELHQHAIAGKFDDSSAAAR